MEDMITKARAAFDAYLSQFDRNDEKIRLKMVHTEGVIACAEEICRRRGMNAEDTQLARLIALLHDIGRFEQVRVYDSFDPAVIDHAAYGVELLFGSRPMIRQFIAEDRYDTIIREAIDRHSRYAVGDDLEPRVLMHARLIRDADKLDNCRVKLEDKIEILLECGAEEAGRQPITPAVWEDCLRRQAVHSEKRRTMMDRWVSYVAYFYDLNFPESCQIVLEEDYVDRIIGRIPYSNPDTAEKMQQLGEMTREYLGERIPHI